MNRKRDTGLFFYLGRKGRSWVGFRTIGNTGKLLQCKHGHIACTVESFPAENYILLKKKIGMPSHAPLHKPQLCVPQTKLPLFYLSFVTNILLEAKLGQMSGILSVFKG